MAEATKTPFNPHRLTRDRMEQIIRAGGSVLLKDRPFPIASVGELPSEAELAKGDPAAEAQAKESLAREMDELRRKMADLEAQQAATAAAVHAPAVAAAPLEGEHPLTPPPGQGPYAGQFLPPPPGVAHPAPPAPPQASPPAHVPPQAAPANPPAPAPAEDDKPKRPGARG